MRLPKWVVKWVKDNFDVDALELKCKQQEEEIKRLKKKILNLKRDRLPEDERRWALNAYLLLTWKFFSWENDLKEKYVELVEFWETINIEDLPF